MGLSKMLGLPELRLQYDAVLPFGVRYSLRYKDGVMGPPEISSLAESRFCGIAPYLAIKALDGNPQAQKLLIEELVNHYASGGYGGIRGIIERNLSRLDSEAAAVGTKVARINIMGPELVESRFSEIAHEAHRDGSVSMLLSYAALIGLKPFVNSLDDNFNLLLLVPKFSETGFVGYSIVKDGKFFHVYPISGISKTEELPYDLSDVMLVDDTINRGTTIRNVLEGWLKDHKLPERLRLRSATFVDEPSFRRHAWNYILQNSKQMPSGLLVDISENLLGPTVH